MSSSCNCDTPETLSGIWFANFLLLLHTVWLFYKVTMKLLAVIFGHETVHCRSKCCALGLDMSDEEDHADKIEDTMHVNKSEKPE